MIRSKRLIVGISMAIGATYMVRLPGAPKELGLEINSLIKDRLDKYRI